MLVIRAGIHKKHVRIANREDPDQTASSEADLCLDLFCTKLKNICCDITRMSSVPFQPAHKILVLISHA